MTWLTSNYEKSAIKWIKCSVITAFITGLIYVFTPSTKEAMLIWGVGSTIDYIQENETAKQLPDKCINALNDWVESLSDPKNNWSDGQTGGEE